MPFDCQNYNDFSILSHKVVSNGWNFMKLTLNINGHGVFMSSGCN